MPTLALRDRLAAAVLILGLLSASVFFIAELGVFGRPGFPLDDSWIHLQFARNLHLGDGLTYNPGEPVAGSTAPLWTAVLALLFWLPGPVFFWVKVLGITLHVAMLDATMRLARELGLGRGLAALAGLLTAATSWLIWSALSGMEIPLFTLLGLWGVIWHIRERRSNSSSTVALPVLGLAVLARPEGALLLVLAVFDRLVLWRRDADGLALDLGSWSAVVKGAAAAAVLSLPVAILNLKFSGSLLPTTFGAKSSGVRDLMPDLGYLYQVLSIFMPSQPWMLLCAGAGVLSLIGALGGKRDRGLLPALWVLALPIAYSTLGGAWGSALVGNFGRYFFPLFPFVIVLGVLGLESAARLLRPPVRLFGARLPLRALLLVVILWPTLASVLKGGGSYLQQVANVEQSDVAMAEWLAPRLDPAAVIAVNDVGALKYLLPNRILDLAGIIDPEVPRYIQQALAAGQNWQMGVVRFLEETRPDYLVIFPGWFPNLPDINPGFVAQFEITIPNNITMGGNVIVVYSTPWTRFPLRQIEAGPAS